MAVIRKETANPTEMILEFSNGDMQKFLEVMDKYKFVNEQALIRYALSIFLVTEDKKIKIKKTGEFISIEPADDLIIRNSDNGTK